VRRKTEHGANQDAKAAKDARRRKNTSKNKKT
jgi:hypothetical protein